MPPTDAPTDRFDDLPAGSSRVGAHRAENPRMRGGIVVLWSVVAIIVIVAVGIVGTLLATGKIALSPVETATPTPTESIEPVVDTSYPVLVLNATAQDGLGGQVRDQIIAAGWPEESVNSGEAGSQDFQHTTVYYGNAADLPAALGLAENVLGGARTELSQAYQPADDPNTADVDESQEKQLVVVIGADWGPGGVATPAP
ncbi:LytR C-terminal domain-containing protein [Microbacterium telephonicum]|uniref:LytR cell envelope-related transcriptional attenuator n=1 Tax=Microbacterium telephonicum TaxID=1714841 RepID=A0A498BUM1_9MICO|nr:LytR C-terminal domain-containing protein [Microbacterium telephonicum]RLK47395.1 LytR cell envelope-related transcriptional attenuator [Microbacterium telephonicum]